MQQFLKDKRIKKFNCPPDTWGALVWAITEFLGSSIRQIKHCYCKSAQMSAQFSYAFEE